MGIVNLKDFKASLNKPKYTTEPKLGRNLYSKNLIDKLEFFNYQMSIYLSDPIIEKCEFSTEGCAIKFISIEEFGSEIVLVNFFATWCKPCRDEHIFIQRFSEENKIKVIGINYKDDSEKTIKWLKKLGNPYSIVAIDKKGKIAINWGVYGIPETFIVNSKGIIKYRHVGPITKKIYKKINQKIKEIN